MTLHRSELVSPCSFLSHPGGPVHPFPGVRPGGGQVHRGPQDPCLHSRRAGGGGAAEDRQGATREGLLAFFCRFHILALAPLFPSDISQECLPAKTNRAEHCLMHACQRLFAVTNLSFSPLFYFFLYRMCFIIFVLLILPLLFPFGPCPAAVQQA